MFAEVTLTRGYLTSKQVVHASKKKVHAKKKYVSDCIFKKFWDISWNFPAGFHHHIGLHHINIQLASGMCQSHNELGDWWLNPQPDDHRTVSQASLLESGPYLGVQK